MLSGFFFIYAAMNLWRGKTLAAVVVAGLVSIALLIGSVLSTS